ncbi:serine-rich adhesin for platelets-like isoform X1 [Mya arenaria]|uniref:serine-rich adhesin for platelets-like isoform X1 n=1 Tax=Mya arenaria TaxID=6604 RepID=UPI0022E1139B|nr:serine-rich adhesin for platelets-like isoform X1 [Mya arenaria]
MDQKELLRCIFQLSGHHLVTDRLQSGMANGGGGKSMAADEMYLMLQADMIGIKQEEQVFQTEIEDIASKVHQLLETCGVDSDSSSEIMAPPSTPSFMKTTASSLTHVTNLETPTFQKTPSRGYSCLSDSDDETRSMFPDIHEIIEGVVNKSDGLPLNISTLSAKTLVDRNSNYIDSPHSEVNDNDTPVIEAIASLDKTSASDSTTSTSTSSSSSSSHRMSSSDGYPKSDESTDNQIVPECYDLDKEFMSRLQYYSDFTLDRQRKINSMVMSCGGTAKDSNTCDAAEEILTRHVEGKESSPEKPAVVFIKPVAPPPSTSSGSDYHSTPSSRQRRDRPNRQRYTRTSRKSTSVPLANSTMLDESFSSSSSGRGSHHGNSLIPKASSTMIYDSGSSGSSGRRNHTGASNPVACSTMLNESFLSTGSSGSSGSRHKSNPMANSTMIGELPPMVPSGGKATISVIRPNSDHSDCESVYTWSIHDGDSGSDKDISLEESYIKKVTNSEKKANNKPPLPPSKRARSGSISSRDSDSEHRCKDHKLHVLLGEPCSKTIYDVVSVIEPSDTCQEEALFVESMCGDLTECSVPKSNTLPRSSTRVKLQDKSSGSSSLGAHRASLPDLTSVCTSNFNDDHSVLESFSDDEMTAMSERPECQGKSSSSNDNPANAASQGSGSANIDSILTDSPTSVCSSGINAPYNSPGTNSSHVSGVSSTSDARSSDSNINTRAPHVNLQSRLVAPANSPKVQNVPVPEGATFKVPKQTQPLKNLFRFRRKSKTPDNKTSTPKQFTNGLPSSKRQLFPSAGTANLQSETRVMDKKAVIRKFKKFSDSFRQRDRSGKPQIETLANL